MGPFARVIGVQTLEQIALVRLARVALAVAAGEALPRFRDPFTGRPLAIRRNGGVTVIAATLPERFQVRGIAPELFSWEVAR